eukprot:7217157-Karenia_brevis.AAC.1
MLLAELEEFCPMPAKILMSFMSGMLHDAYDMFSFCVTISGEPVLLQVDGSTGRFDALAIGEQ